MNTTAASLRRWLGTSGLAFVALNVLFLAMVLSIGGPPPRLNDPKLVSFLHDHNARLATVTVISYFSIAPFFIFVAALRSLIRDAVRDRVLADVVFALGVVLAGVAFVALGIMATAQAAAAGNSDPAAVRTLEELGRSMGNLPSTLEWGMLMCAASLAFWRTRVLPRWVAWVGWCGAAVILCTAGSAYVGDTNSFFAADSGVGLIGLLPFLVWVVCTSVAALKAPISGHETISDRSGSQTRNAAEPG